MNSKNVGSVAVWAAAMMVCAGAASAQTGQVYHLRAGSTAQEGCFGACLCPVSLPEPMRGRFVLTQTSVDPLFTNYSVTNAEWRVRFFNQTLTGSGTYRIGGEVALMEQMTLDLSVNDQAPRHFDSGTNPVGPGPAFPVITVHLRVPNQNCWNMELEVHATPLMGDWDGDGHLGVQDVFDFVASWFAGDGDANEDGVTNVQDIFDFLNGWFAGT